MKVLIIVLTALFLVSCGDKIQTKDALTYQMIEIDGMTCIRWVSGAYQGGLTCNWDEWEKQ